jgi:hypothetical protein
MIEKTAAFRQRRAADTARWRERLGSGRYERVVDTRRRQARWRARVREGRAIFKLELLHDRVIEALIVSRRLSEDAALRRSEVERELAAVVEQWAERWLAKNS